MSTIQDLIKYSNEQKPIEFEHAFIELVGERIEAAVLAKKVEIAKEYFGNSETEE